MDEKNWGKIIFLKKTGFLENIIEYINLSIDNW